jgi:hypothetical protein
MQLKLKLKTEAHKGSSFRADEGLKIPTNAAIQEVMTTQHASMLQGLQPSPNYWYMHPSWLASAWV